MNLFIEVLKMAIYEQLNATMADRDTKAYLDYSMKIVYLFFTNPVMNFQNQNGPKWLLE